MSPHSLPAASKAAYAPLRFWLALGTLLATFPLVFMGGLVTSHGAGLTVPDWPNSYDYNMFLFPPSQWIGGIFYEHTHRLLGTIVGLLATFLLLHAWGPARARLGQRLLGGAFFVLILLTLITVTILTIDRDPLHDKLRSNLSHLAVLFGSLALVSGFAWRCRTPEPRRWARWLTATVFGAVCVQGVLGGLRVVWVNLDLAIVHGCFAQAFFCLAGFATLAFSRWWMTRPAADPVPDPALARLRRLGTVTVALLFLQLILGATMRHYGAGLAIPDFPTSYGKILPPLDATEAAAASGIYLPLVGARPFTVGEMWLHFGHRVGAVLATIAVMWMVGLALTLPGRRPGLLAGAVGLSLLLVMQLTLGVLTVLFRKPADIASTHVAVGALLLLTVFMVTAVAARLTHPSAGTTARMAVTPLPAGKLGLT